MFLASFVLICGAAIFYSTSNSGAFLAFNAAPGGSNSGAALAFNAAPNGSAVSSVPEIDASSGALALAAVAAMLLLSYELRKRKAKS